ncbi:MAG: transposase, partial [Kiritimatiellia bacterium]|nr:transposase [Kiritimatiellia bacterium]
MKGWDYTAPGCYFVTLNTRKNRALFGAIVNGRMILNEAGRVAEDCWKEIPAHFSTVALDAFVIMPNHMHGVLHLKASGDTQTPALGGVVGAYKAAVSRIIRRGGKFPARPLPAGASAIWHRNYWDVIIREERALANIRAYIRENPRNYAAVINVGEPECAGNRKLMSMPKTGFLASRGAAILPGSFTMKPNEAIISGFLSPMEQTVFRARLQHKKPLIWVKSWGLDEAACTVPVRQAIHDGHLLIISPFPKDVDAPSARRAAWCNHYVLTHCDRMIVGHLNPGGMLACILSEADP